MFVFRILYATDVGFVQPVSGQNFKVYDENTLGTVDIEISNYDGSGGEIYVFYLGINYGAQFRINGSNEFIEADNVSTANRGETNNSYYGQGF